MTTDAESFDEMGTWWADFIVMAAVINGMITSMLSIASVVAQRQWSAARNRGLKNRLTTSAGQFVITNDRTFPASIFMA